MPAEVDPSVLAGRRILFGVTGGIAAYKSALLARLLVGAGADVQVIMTPAATRFVGPDTFAALTRRPVHSDVFDGNNGKSGSCPRGSTNKTTPLMLHVWLIDNPDGPFAADMEPAVLGTAAPIS